MFLHANNIMYLLLIDVYCCLWKNGCKYLAKVEVAGPNPVSRSIEFKDLGLNA